MSAASSVCVPPPCSRCVVGLADWLLLSRLFSTSFLLMLLRMLAHTGSCAVPSFHLISIWRMTLSSKLTLFCSGVILCPLKNWAPPLPHCKMVFMEREEG